MNYGNGFFYLAEIGVFRLAQNGRFRPALTPKRDSVNYAVLIFRIKSEFSRLRIATERAEEV